jgi:hypothetical protein
MKQLAIVTLAAVLALSACSGGDDDDAGADTDATTTTVDAAALTTELEGQLLTLEDLATEDSLDAAWLEGNVQEGVDIDLPACVVEETPAGALAGAEAKFVRDTAFKLPSLEEDLAVFADAAGASAAYEAAVARYDGCTPEFTFEGATSTGTIAPLALTLGGDEAKAWRITVTIAETPISITSIHVLQGDHELSLVHVDAAVPAEADLEDYAAKALAHLT